MTDMDAVTFGALKAKIENLTGFVCYEPQPGNQLVWYGTSDKFDDFRELVGPVLKTGTYVMLMDTGKTVRYSAQTGMFYGAIGTPVSDQNPANGNEVSY